MLGVQELSVLCGLVGLFGFVVEVGVLFKLADDHVLLWSLVSVCLRLGILFDVGRLASDALR